MVDIALFFQPLHIIGEACVEYALIIFLGIDEKHHAKVDMPAENTQQLSK